MIIANAIMGDRPEPFLPFCLESIEDAVDLLVINDNSANPENPNLNVLFDSGMHREGKVDLIKSNFKELSGFDGARNLCLDRVGELRKEGKTEGEIWILYLDCDEVHRGLITRFARKFIPSVPLDFGVVDGYFYQFIQSFDYYTSLERRHNLFFRYTPEVRWELPVHERLVNIKGKRLATDYTYFHYGYVFPPDGIIERWQLYEKYDGVPFEVAKVDRKTMMDDQAPLCMRFSEPHPEAMEKYIAQLRENKPEYLEYFENLVKKSQGDKRIVVKNYFRHLNYKLRLLYRKSHVYFSLLGSRQKLLRRHKGS